MNMAYRLSGAFSELGMNTRRNEIEKDNNEINRLINAAKFGNWELVWRILGDPRNPINGDWINIIPESRRWGILHQAVYWNNANVLRKVLSYKSCDNDIPTKPCTFDNNEQGVKTPLEIARMYGYTTMSQILEGSSQSLTNQSLETFQASDQEDGRRGFRLLSITIAAYKTAFHPKAIDPNTSLFNIMKNIFRDVNTSDGRLNAIKDKVCEAVEGVCSNTHSNIQASGTREEFYAAIIKTYTEEQNSRLYTYLNTAMRRQNETDYRPTSRDLALGPYILMYEILLLFWGDLKRESKRTFRRMRVSAADQDQYVVGRKFKWVSFVSSSTEKENAVAFPTCEVSGDRLILFTIDNSMPGIWQPRNIESYASYIENERTYPAGAHFEVVWRMQTDQLLSVQLRLLNGRTLLSK